MLDWQRLLSEERRKPRQTTAKAGDYRKQHERDYDRILFSTPVRRLQDKTQVFPLEPNDSVRTRLTHSHEVANLCRSIGMTLAFEYASQLELPEAIEPKRAIPAVLAAAGLAHDLGNPPFGHQGEHAIQSWMKRADGLGFLTGLSEAQRQDFLSFEGNAQGLRVLTRLQVINDNFGLNLTYATLAALLKYPTSSDRRNKANIATKKFNYFQSETDIVDDIWSHTGLSAGVRHPLTFVMEACDDIAYSVIDVEDGAKKGLVSLNDLLAWLEHQCDGDEVTQALCSKIKARDSKFRDFELSPSELNDISMQMFRVDAIGVMVTAATKAFVSNIVAIREGTFNDELLAQSEARVLAGCLKRFTKRYVYSHRSVLEVELKGHRAIHRLMDILWGSVTKRSDPDDLNSGREPFEQYVYSRISENYRRVAATDERMPLRYRELQLVTDMVSGMTDSYAVQFLSDLEAHNGSQA